MANGKIWAQDQARSIILRQGIKSAPVPIDKIARTCGVTLQYAPFDDELSGMAFIKNGVPFIGVNSLHHPNRQRFTIAHELGHHILHKDLLGNSVHVDKVILKRDRISSSGVDLNEIEANAFAAEILMPTAWIETLISDGLDVADEVKVSDIARKFKVSVAALQFKIFV